MSIIINNNAASVRHIAVISLLKFILLSIVKTFLIDSYKISLKINCIKIFDKRIGTSSEYLQSQLFHLDNVVAYDTNS